MTIVLKCVRDMGWGLPEDYRGLHVMAQTVFHLTLDKRYQAHGLALFNGGLIALVIDDNGLPSWHPIEAFVVVDGRLPPDWRFGLRDEDGSAGIQALWGYAALIDDPDHVKALTESDSSALTAFFEAAERGGAGN